MRELILCLTAVVMLPLLAACPSDEGETPALANMEPTPLPQADMSAMERRRASSDGAALEVAAHEARAAGATKVYASNESEPGLVEFTVGGELSGASEALAVDGNETGEAVPSDLEKANDEVGPWIDMDLVGRTIRGQNRSLKTCYGDASARNPDLGRRVDLRLTVDGRGRASGVRVTSGSPVQDSGLERCLVGVLEKATFPEARNGTKTFDYPISF